MSIIGRLDEQVDAVLISPLEKRRGAEDDNTPDSPEGTKPERTEESNPAKTETPNDDSRLPVWLL